MISRNALWQSPVRNMLINDNIVHHVMWNAMDELRFAFHKEMVDAKLEALSSYRVCLIVSFVTVV